jgi:hypothetical protein
VSFRRLTLLAFAAGLLAACALTLANMIAGPQVCVATADCVRLSGEASCSPSYAGCSGQLVPLQTVAALSVALILVVAVILGMRRSR